MTHYDWNQMPPEQLNPQLTRRAIHTANLTIARLKLLRGAVVPEHSHVHEQVATVERGSLLFHIGGQEVVVSAGQSLAIPSNMPHQVTALEDSDVIDIFSPSREDWIRGDDGYLRK